MMPWWRNIPTSSAPSATEWTDILGVPMTLINQEIDKHTDYTIQRNKLYFYGVCRSCQAKEA